MTTVLLAAVFLYFVHDLYTIFSRKRLIANIPTSKIRSMSMGLVEVKGIARHSPPLLAPFSNQPVAYYSYTVEAGNSGWKTIGKGSSEQLPFELEDDTGKCMILPYKATMNIGFSYQRVFKAGGGIPARARDFLERWKIPYSDIFDHDKRLRITEYTIQQNQEIYVIGMCHDLQNTDELQLQGEISMRIQNIKDSENFVKDFDLDGDGDISPAEWQRGVADVESKVHSELNSELNSESDDTLYISYTNDRNSFFMISTNNEELVSIVYKFELIIKIMIAITCLIFLYSRVSY